MSAERIEIDTKGLCLLCLKDSSSLLGSHKVQGVDWNDHLTAFKMLLRYLKIDLLKLSNFYCSLGEWMDGMENIDVVVSLCRGCAIFTLEFCSLYRNFELFRMKLDKCTMSLYDLMKEGDDSEGRLKEFRRRMKTTKPTELLNLSIAENLRKETRQKCYLKATACSVPRVTLSREQEDDLNYFATSSTSRAGVNAMNPDAMVKVESCYSDHEDHVNYDESGYEPLWNFSDQTQIEPGTTHEHDSSSAQNSIGVKGGNQNDKEKPILCNHCGKTSSSHSNQQIHMLTQHTFEHYAEVLPPGTSKEGLEASIKTIMDKYMVQYPEEKKKPYGCSLCKKSLQGKFWLRYHMLKYHFDEIHSLVQKEVKALEEVPIIIGYNNEGPIYAKSPGKRSNTPRPEQKPVVAKKSLSKKDSTFNIGETSETKRLHICGYCGRQSSDQCNLMSHLMTIHPLLYYSDQLPPETTEASLKVVVNDMVSHHRKCSKDKKIKSFVCSFCPKFFQGLHALKYHILKKHFSEVLVRLDVHPDSKTQNKMMGDGKSNSFLNATSSSSTYIKKIPGLLPVNKSIKKQKLGKGAKYHKCTICGSCFQSGSDFSRHLRTHSGKKSYSCEHCGKKSGERYSHRVHNILIHPMETFKDQIPPGTTEIQLQQAIQMVVVNFRKCNPNKTYACVFCSKIIKSSAYWKVHVLQCHFEKVIGKLGGISSINYTHRPTNRRNPVIRKKLAKYSKSSYLTGKSVKVAVGNSNGPLNCEYCGKAFSTINELRVHAMRMHTSKLIGKFLPPNIGPRKLDRAVETVFDEYMKLPADGAKQFPCLHCPGGFTKASLLKVHVLRLHMDLLIAKVQEELKIPQTFSEQILTTSAFEGNNDVIGDIENGMGNGEGEAEIEMEYENELVEDEQPIPVVPEDEEEQVFTQSQSIHSFDDPLNECNY